MTEQTRRASRLLEIHRMLVKRGSMSAAELARALDYSQRTIQRDLQVLESELRIPLIYENRRYRIMPGGQHPLGPVRFTLQEARAMFLASRLFVRYADELDPDGITALEKLAETLPQAIARQVEYTVHQLRGRPEKTAQVEVLRKLTEAWANSLTIRMEYRSSHAQAAYETNLDPYLLEPSASGYSTYVVGFSSKHGEVRIFKLDRIQSVQPTTQSFHARDVNEIVDQLGRSWGGVVFGEDKYDVTVDFTSAVAGRISESNWHPSQQLEPLPDGGVRLRVVLPSLLEFVPWVLGWGADAMVVGPPELHDQIAQTIRTAAQRYSTAAE
jgi:predicted DNA-binding transcriptional regulator YafY